MNVEKLQQLKAWLEDGAPHIIFNMAYGIADFEETLDQLDPDEYYNALVQRNAKGIGNCGSICCIAGYTVHMDAVSKGATKEQLKDLQHMGWASTAYEALRILELYEVPSSQSYDNWIKHPLFNHELAPDMCTPQEAAKAVQNLLDGVEPTKIWEGVR